MKSAVKFLFWELIIFLILGSITLIEVINFRLFESFFTYIKTPSSWFIGLSISYAFSKSPLILLQPCLFSCMLELLAIAFLMGHWMFFLLPFWSYFIFFVLLLNVNNYALFIFIMIIMIIKLMLQSLFFSSFSWQLCAFLDEPFCLHHIFLALSRKEPI